MWVHGAQPGSLADGSHPSMSGTAVEALAVVAADDGPFVAFTHGEVDRTRSPRHQRNVRWLVALTEDRQRAVPVLGGVRRDATVDVREDLPGVVMHEIGDRPAS